MMKTQKSLLLDFLHVAQKCVETCTVDETTLVDDTESLGLTYEGAPSLFEYVHSLKSKYRDLPLPWHASTTPYHSLIATLMKLIKEKPYLKRAWLVELYLIILSLAVDSEAIELTELKTSYITGVDGINWKKGVN